MSERKFNLFKEKIFNELDRFRLLSDSMYYMTNDVQFKENIELAFEMCVPIKNNEIEISDDNIQVLKNLALQMKGKILLKFAQYTNNCNLSLIPCFHRYEQNDSPHRSKPIAKTF